MKTLRIFLLILLFIAITASFAFVFVRYQDERKLSAADPEESMMAIILLSKVKDIKDRNESNGFWYKDGNFSDLI